MATGKPIKRRTTKTTEDGEVRNKCAEPIVNLDDEQRLINALSWIKFKITKKMFTPEQIGELLKITADYKQV